MRPIRKIMPSGFPALLKEINDPPECLYLRGEFPPETHRHLAVVGSRKFTQYGKDACESLIAGLCGLPIAIVSGLALGIDGIAHRAALAAGLPTIAVPGSGIDDDSIHPPSNRRLAQEILDGGGCLLSPFPEETPGYPQNFPERNRIMAGLCHAVLIIEAEKKSGTMITARLAADYNRDVLAVPGSIFSSKSDGPHYLIGAGAKAITRSDDIREALGIPDLKSAGQKTEEAKALRFAGCSEDEKDILALLAEPRSRDDLIRLSGRKPGEISIILTLLELKGLIRESLGAVRLS